MQRRNGVVRLCCRQVVCWAVAEAGQHVGWILLFFVILNILTNFFYSKMLRGEKWGEKGPEEQQAREERRLDLGSVGTPGRPGRVVGAEWGHSPEVSVRASGLMTMTTWELGEVPAGPA